MSGRAQNVSRAQSQLRRSVLFAVWLEKVKALGESKDYLLCDTLSCLPGLERGPSRSAHRKTDGLNGASDI